MTKLQPNKPVVRELDVRHEGDAIVVELHPGHLIIRQKGKGGKAAEFSYDFLFRNAGRFGRVKG